MVAALTDERGGWLGWLVIPLDHGVHIVRNAERTRHELDVGCWCGPSVERENRDTGVEFDVPLVTHRAAANG